MNYQLVNKVSIIITNCVSWNNFWFKISNIQII